MPLAIHVPKVFVLTAEVERDDTTASGFRSAELQLSTGTALFGQLRFDGIAAMARVGFTEKIIVVGGREMRYEQEYVSRAEAFRDILVKDLGVTIPVEALRTDSAGSPNSATAISVIEEAISDAPQENFAVITSLYHIPRISDDMKDVGLHFVRTYPAEAFFFVENPSKESWGRLLADLDYGTFAERVADELKSPAAKILGRRI